MQEFDLRTPLSRLPVVCQQRWPHLRRLRMRLNNAVRGNQ